MTSVGAGRSTIDDAQLVARCRAGDEAAWALLVDRFSRYVYAICAGAYRLREPDAEDVFQEVFTRVYTRLDRLRDDSALRPWIGQLTRRLCVDRLRSGPREPVELEEEMAVDRAIEKLDDALAVHQALAALPEHCQEVLDSFFCQDRSYQEIGVALAIPAGTIASRISRCLGRLRAIYGVPE